MRRRTALLPKHDPKITRFKPEHVHTGFHLDALQYKGLEQMKDSKISHPAPGNSRAN
jgi:hypothetical protein